MERCSKATFGKAVTFMVVVISLLICPNIPEKDVDYFKTSLKNSWDHLTNETKRYRGKLNKFSTHMPSQHNLLENIAQPQPHYKKANQALWYFTLLNSRVKMRICFPGLDSTVCRCGSPTRWRGVTTIVDIKVTRVRRYTRKSRLSNVEGIRPQQNPQPGLLFYFVNYILRVVLFKRLMKELATYGYIVMWIFNDIHRNVSLEVIVRLVGPVAPGR